MKTKRIFLTTVFYSICLLAFSQTQLVYETNNHLEFNGMSLSGDLNVFVDKLQKQGYTIKSTGEYYVIFDAEIIGKPCELTVIGTKKSKIVYRVSITLPPGTDWQSIKADYNKLKTQYIENYGVGTSKELFLAPYTEGDGNEMEAIATGKVSYSTAWRSESGIIMIGISDSKEVFIAFRDRTNNIINKNEKIEN